MSPHFLWGNLLLMKISNALAAPARCEDLAGLPPAWVGVGTNDLFHDEDVAYARRLQEAGVDCTLEVVSGAYHGFDVIESSASVPQAFVEAQLQALADALGCRRTRQSPESLLTFPGAVSPSVESKRRVGCGAEIPDGRRRRQNTRI